MKISKYLIGACLTSLLVLNAACIDDTFPTTGATEDQLAGSQNAKEGAMWGVVSYANNTFTVSGGDWHGDFGYGAMLHIRDLMTEDMTYGVQYAGHWSNFHNNLYLGKNYMFPQFIWNYYYKFIQRSNLLIGLIDEETATDTEKGLLAVGLTFRAMQYLDLARMYEFLPNDIFPTTVNDENNDLAGLTVPIMTEKTTLEESRHNPRATREEMAEFINNDLDKAEEYIPLLPYSYHTLPHLDVVYGLRARLYLWLEDYANAALYANKAIAASSTQVMTREQCLSTTTGFNDCDIWMWGSRMVKENDAVQTGIVNWTSWMSNEAEYGYAGNGAYNLMGASLYNKISVTDFRKLMYQAPQGSVLEGKMSYINPSMGESLPPYAALKFRPGSGNTKDPLVGNACSYPLMRVEEMHFIAMEAAAQLNDPNAGKMLVDFMHTYRDKGYVLNLNDDRTLVDEIILQKRIELWGEGLTFFDVKRLNMSVTREYPGSNFIDGSRFNTKGRPAWMNFCIVRTEENNNSALVGFNNPDPSGKY